MPQVDVNMRSLLCRRSLVAFTLLAALPSSWCPLAAWAAEYGDVTFERRTAGVDDIPPAVFPHWVHRMQFKCAACHDDLFKMKAGSSKVTMDAIQDGRSCGVCHDGKAAFESNFDTCPRCHRK